MRFATPFVHTLSLHVALPISIVHTNTGGTAPLWVHGDSRIVNAGTYDFHGDSNGIMIGDGSTSTFINTDTTRQTTGDDTAAVRSYIHVSYFVNRDGSFDVEAG